MHHFLLGFIYAMYKCLITDKNIYFLSVNFSQYKFTVFPMIRVLLFGSGFGIEIGLFSFIIEISKSRNMSHEEMCSLMKDIINVIN